MLNVVTLMGRLTADPELKTTTGGTSICSFTIAVERSYVNHGEERKCDFINIVAWRNTAEFICKYFVKGSTIAIDGSIQTRKYEDRDGNKRNIFEVVANRAYFCEKKQSLQPDKSEALVQNFQNQDFEEIDMGSDIPF